MSTVYEMLVTELRNAAVSAPEQFHLVTPYRFQTAEQLYIQDSSRGPARARVFLNDIENTITYDDLEAIALVCGMEFSVYRCVRRGEWDYRVASLADESGWRILNGPVTLPTKKEATVRAVVDVLRYMFRIYPRAESAAKVAA
jgi:hypothetical protein